MISEYIKNLININKTSRESINALESVIKDIKIENDKDKANFGNLCLILKSNRIIADATEAMLINEDVLQDENGDFYQKIKEDTDAPKSNNAEAEDK